MTAVQEHVKPGGRAIVNVLIEGTTYLGMFDPDNYCLFRRNELEERFDGWSILESRYQTFPAPEGTRKDFATIIAEKAELKELKSFSNDLNRVSSSVKLTTQLK